jgi:uncharacterized membrane protein
VTVSTSFFFIAAMAVLGFADFALKRASGRISPSLGTLIYAVATVLPPLLWTAWARAHQPLLVTRDGVLWSIVTGLAFGAFAGLLFFLFSQGVNLSFGTPIIRLGGIAFAALLGIIVLREPFTVRSLIGFLLAATGIAVIASR